MNTNTTNTTTSYIMNALPGSIIPDNGATLVLRPIGPQNIPADAVSAIGHTDTAAVVSGIIGRDLQMNRVSVPTLAPGQVHYLALYRGPRLPEGATQLPEGAVLGLFELVVS
jgi:hypothetical protein